MREKGQTEVAKTLETPVFSRGIEILTEKKKFLSVKAKYVYFYLIPSLLEKPLAVNYDKSKVMPPTSIDCELLFYSEYDNAVIHLGLEQEEENEFYFPRTFFVEKLGKPKKNDIYIDNQEPIIVTKQNRIIMI